MTKKYISTTCLHISIVLPNGCSKHITFNALSNGKSEYYTSDEDEQYGLEHHARFNDAFRLAKETPIVEKQEQANPAPEERGKVTVTDIYAAKDYLADNFGLSRTKLRKKEDVMAAAAARNIEFVGI